MTPHPSHPEYPAFSCAVALARLAAPTLREKLFCAECSPHDSWRDVFSRAHQCSACHGSGLPSPPAVLHAVASCASRYERTAQTVVVMARVGGRRVAAAAHDGSPVGVALAALEALLRSLQGP